MNLKFISKQSYYVCLFFIRITITRVTSATTTAGDVINVANIGNNTNIVVVLSVTTIAQT